jgi:hypothetical protein
MVIVTVDFAKRYCCDDDIVKEGTSDNVLVECLQCEEAMWVLLLAALC